MCEQLICGQNGKHFLLIKSLYFFCACLASSSNSAGLALYVSVCVYVCLTLVLKARVCAHLCRTASMIISFLFLFLCTSQPWMVTYYSEIMVLCFKRSCNHRKELKHSKHECMTRLKDPTELWEKRLPALWVFISLFCILYL